MNILIDGQTLHTAEIDRGIGTYFQEMIEAMLRNDFVNTFYITVDNIEKLQILSDFSQNKLIVLINDKYNPSLLLNSNRQTATDIYSELIAKECLENNIKVYWNPNPQMDNTILPIKSSYNKVKYVATIYDLIPLVMKDVYFAMWHDFIKNEYINKIKILQDYSHLFPISQSSKKDLSALSSVSEDKQTVVFCGVNQKFKPYPFPKTVSDEEYILYIGGFDPRKNMFRAIETYSIFMKKYNSSNINYKLYLVCNLDEAAKSELFEYAKKYNIEENLVLTGFVEEEKLLSLYQKAQCFFFPSLYEGFGLPILEALASGLPIACADNSSLPEVAGEFAHYFDAYNVDAMALSLDKALKDGMDLDSRTKRFEYASKYTWEKPAQILLDGMLNLETKINIKKNKKIAWVSPLPPQRSGISNYSKILLLAMKDDVEIEIYYDSVMPEEELTKKFRTLPLKKLDKNFEDYDEVIYHLGNNSEFHTNIYKYAWNYPSTVVIHDWNMHPFMQHSFLGTKDNDYYEDAIKLYGEDGIKELELIKKRGYPIISKFPMSDKIAGISKRVIVHHKWVKDQLYKQSNVEVIPHFSYIDLIPKNENIIEFKEKYNIFNQEFLITTFGDINLNKLPNINIEAVKLLLDEGYPIKFLFVGNIMPETKVLFDELKLTHYSKYIKTTAYLDYASYYSCMYASDLIINLRNPSNGEASGTLAQSFFAEKAVVIGELAQYNEFPDEIVAGKIRYDGSEVEQLVEILKVQLENKERRESVEKMAKEYSSCVLGLKNIVNKYLKDMDCK